MARSKLYIVMVLVVIVGFNYDVVVMSVGCGPPPNWVLVVIVGFNYDVIMMYVGCGPPPPGILVSLYGIVIMMS